MASRLVMHEGRLARAVETYQFVEDGQLESTVQQKQEAFDSKQAALEDLLNRVETAEAELGAAERELEEAKSELAVGQTMVEQSGDTEGGAETPSEDGSNGQVENLQPQY